MRLVNFLASRYSKDLGRPIDPMTEVAICVGASGALYATSMALCDTWTQARAALTEHARDVATDDVRLYMCVLRTATWRC